DLGVHLVDLIRWNFGEPVRVSASAGIAYPTRTVPGGEKPADTEDFCTVMAELASGAQATLLVSRGARAANEQTLEAYGSLGALRYRLAGESGWTVPDLGKVSIHGPGFIERAIADVVACFLEGRKCQLDASNALSATEIIFGAYESCRHRGRVDFPLLIDDNPLAAMVKNGDLKPAPPKP
ncbi:MAG: Gfo/Idh/MocA family oxidoreductase, partial [Elusimicrobiota bacterium]